MISSVNASRDFKRRLLEGEVCFGAAVTLADPCVTEIMCGSRYDFLVLDAEHAPHDCQTLQHHLIAAAGSQTTCIVRVTWNHKGLIKRALDMGAGGVIVPMVKSTEDVRQAVAACMYPPTGIRGFGPRRASGYGRIADYAETANDDVIVWAQIERVEAVEQIDEILAVPGLTGVYLGRCDLSGSMGILGQIRHPRVSEAVDHVIVRAREAGVPVGMGGPVSGEDARELIGKGMQFFTIGGDWGFLAKLADMTIRRFRAIAQGGDVAASTESEGEFEA